MAERVILGDDGTWFDPGAASTWEGKQRPGDFSFTSQRLYLTRKGAWILRTWSRLTPGAHTHEVLDVKAAYGWLLVHGHAEAIPDEALQDGEI